MKENECALLILSILEAENLKTSELYDRLYKRGYTKNERNLTSDRDIGFIQKTGINLEPENHQWVLIRDETYHEGVAEIVKKLLSIEFPELVHGEVLKSTLSNKLFDQSSPADFIYIVLQAIKQRRLLHYKYIAQHPDTIELGKQKHQDLHSSANNPDGSFPVTMLPRLFVFGGDNMVISGERYKEGDSVPELRQYELTGIQKIKVGAKQGKKIAFDKDILYKNSMYFWQGGKEYVITIEESNGKQTTRTVNGEDEILSYVAASLGKKKIINPPPEIVAKAKKYKISGDVFVYHD